MVNLKEEKFWVELQVLNRIQRASERLCVSIQLQSVWLYLKEYVLQQRRHNVLS